MYIILGKNGYIAEAIIKELKSRDLPHVAWSRSDVDYTNLAELKYNLYILGEDLHIINCAGYIGKPNVDACELAKADCIEGNVLLPAMLAQLCHENKYDFTQISSGCIYGGYEKDFTEQDAPNFDFQNGSFYSGTKALAEKVVLQNNANSYIFRLRIPFDEYASPRNYLTKLLSYDTLLDAKNSLSHRADFAKYTMDLIEQKVPHGIYNITNKGSITTKDVVSLIEKHLKPNKEFKFFSKLDNFMQEVTAPRSNCVLDTSKIEQYIPIRTAEEALEDAISNYMLY
ncbi:MAG: NAD-dependent epimerase/dehydratase family protein [Flavobacteriia bacterium]|nr:NAD-dependent epimerase/dehydratase family protein [Flavobacteriia bacterium]